MNEEQRTKLLEILNDILDSTQSVDEAFNQIEDLIWEIRDDARRSVE